MGIYDREYYGPPRGRSGGPWAGVGSGGFSPKNWSVTIWLIVINSAIFLLGQIPPLNGTYHLPAARIIDANVPEDRIDRSYTLDGVEVRGQSAEGEPLKFHPIVAPLRQGEQPVNLYTDLAGRPILSPKNEPLDLVGKDVYYEVPGGVLGALGHFSTFQGFVRLEVWRLVTFQFLHANFMHIFFNMFGLWIFGGIVEQYLGKQKYLAYYLICGISGGLLYLILNGIGQLGLPLPGALDINWRTSLVGASAGVFGVIMGCAKISPHSTIQLLFPPIPIKMRVFAYGYVGIALFGLLFNAWGNAGGDAAHIGGAIAGYFFIRNTHLLKDFFDVLGKPRDKARSRKPKKSKPGKPAEGGFSKAPKKDEVDRILAKVGTQGLQSLTDKEKRTLERASRAERERS